MLPAIQVLLCSLALIGAMTSAAAQPAPAQPWPQRTVRMITPLGPGSGMDVVARTFAERLSAKWGQPVVVENRQGADGILAVQSFLSDRDNHSLMFAFAGLLSINPLIHGDKLPYDVRDVVPVASAIDSTLALTVSETMKTDTLGEFIKAQRQVANLSLREMARLTDVSNAYLSQIERGLHQPSVRVLRSLAEALNVSAETLLQQAGLIEEDGPGEPEKIPEPPAGPERTVAAILSDPSLTPEQREALLTVYRSYSASG